jgi:hypothetical protein
VVLHNVEYLDELFSGSARLSCGDISMEVTLVCLVHRDLLLMAVAEEILESLSKAVISIPHIMPKDVVFPSARVTMVMAR